MIEEIRKQQLQQGFEPCFATTRLFQEPWVINNCVECTHRPTCLRAIHSTIVSIHAGTSDLPFSEQVRIMDEAKNSQVVKKVTALVFASMSDAGISVARAGEQHNKNLKKKGKKK